MVFIKGIGRCEFMFKIYHSIRFRIMLISVLFTLLLSTAIGYASYAIFARSEQHSSIQSAEFNLHLVTGLIYQDIVNLNTLANLCTTEPDVISYFSASHPSAKHSLDAYAKIQNIYNANQSSHYVQRLILTDSDERLLQIGSSLINSVPLTRYNLHQFPYIMEKNYFSWQTITRDPFATSSFPDCIPLIQPIFSRGQVNCGTLYLSVSTEIITNQLAAYQLNSNDLLYLHMNGKNWIILGNTLKQDDTIYTEMKILQDIARDKDTTVKQLISSSGQKYISVSCSIGNSGMYISHYLPTTRFIVRKRFLLLCLIAEFILIQLLGLVIILLLNRLIIHPVSKLQERLSTIASGDFTPDTSVEWNNELGNIGRQINQLSLDVQDMMNARVADEKERQRLEYQMLQSQISPHFIYNTLNSIKWMATIQKATGIVEMTSSLSHLLKYISKNREDLIPLRDELSLLHDYCTIQQYRYGAGIIWEIADLPDQALYDCVIPRFTLQPLVENSVFHGIEPNGGIGRVSIRFILSADHDYFVLIDDDGVGMSAETIDKIFSVDDISDQKFLQIGIRNVHQRILYAFGDEYGITINSAPNKGTHIKIHLPLRFSSQKEAEIC